jgi:hypothetical protein
VGLSVEQAKEVIEKCRQSALPTEIHDQIPVLKSRPVENEIKPPPTERKVSQVVGLPVRENNRLEKELPAVSKKVSEVKIAPPPKPQPAPKPATPAVNMARKTLEEQVTKATLAEAPFDTFHFNPQKAKTSMHDVKSNPVEYGPVDEIRYFNLADFRRLSTDPVEAANRLKQKFINLRDESILLYFEAWDAWKSSPLFHDYLKSVSESLSKRIPLARVAADKSRIQMSEINALVRMEKQLG